MAGQGFPIEISYGLSGLFRVMQVGVGLFHIEQQTERTTAGKEAVWQLLATSKHMYAQEAIEVLHEAQKEYFKEMIRREKLMRELSS